MKSWQKEIVLFEKVVQICAYQTDDGIQVLIAGGDRPHIGAVSIVDDKFKLITHGFEGHKDNVISDQWAKKLSQYYKVPVVVSVGIHYDTITPKQINIVVETMKQLLEELKTTLIPIN